MKSKDYYGITVILIIAGLFSIGVHLTTESELAEKVGVTSAITAIVTLTIANWKSMGEP